MYTKLATSTTEKQRARILKLCEQQMQANTRRVDQEQERQLKVLRQRLAKERMARKNQQQGEHLVEAKGAKVRVRACV